MYSSILSGAICGISGFIANVEVDISTGLPCFDIVGHINHEIREARERVPVALKNSGIKLPPAHITVNISPASISKSGTLYDLPIALGILSGMEKISMDSLSDTLIMGELGLNGEIKRVKGVLPIILEAKLKGIKKAILPKDNVSEASCVEGIDIWGVDRLSDFIDKLLNKSYEFVKSASLLSTSRIESNNFSKDYIEVDGQELCKRAAIIAAAGFHHLLIVGPPGSGKTMIADRLPSIMPPLNSSEKLEVSAIFSVSGLLTEEKPLITHRPFMHPHHTLSRQALSGGGNPPRPGIISLAHRGVLFLDEFPEFARDSIESLREPLEDKQVMISRLSNSFTFPSDFLLVAAANPCPCGFYPDRNLCNCSSLKINKYRSKISGPILDRIDLCVSSQKIEANALLGLSSKKTLKNKMSSEDMRLIVMKAIKIQQKRYEACTFSYNSQLPLQLLDKYAPLGEEEKEYLANAYELFKLSARSLHKVQRVARTIADLEESENITVSHIAEALTYKGGFDNEIN